MKPTYEVFLCRLIIVVGITLWYTLDNGFSAAGLSLLLVAFMRWVEIILGYNTYEKNKNVSGCEYD